MSDDSAAQKKAKIMHDRTETARKLFGLDLEEVVVQDYHAAKWESIILAQGRMYITQHHVCFYSMLPKIELRIPFRQIKEVKAAKAMMFVDTAIEILLHDGTKHYFRSFVHRDECLHLIEYLMKHPVTVITEEQVEAIERAQQERLAERHRLAEAEQKKMDEEQQRKRLLRMKREYRAPASRGGGASSGSFARVPMSSTTSVSSGGAGTFDLQEQMSLERCTQRGKNVLKVIEDTKDIGASTLGELHRQGEQLDRAETTLDETHAKLREAKRILKDLSWTGLLKGEKTRRETPSAGATLLRKLDTKESFLMLDILLKLPDDLLEPARLLFGSSSFAIWHPTEDGPYEGTGYTKSQWDYSEVNGVVLRARPLHVDILIGDVKKRDKHTSRVRLMSSDLQLLVNELVLKCGGAQACTVTFEPGIAAFPYGKEVLRMVPRARSHADDRLSKFGRLTGEAQRRDSLLSAELDLGEEFERQLDEMSDGIGHLHAMSQQMGVVIAEQNRQLDRMNEKADDTDRLMKQQNKRIGKMLN